MTTEQPNSTGIEVQATEGLPRVGVDELVRRLVRESDVDQLLRGDRSLFSSFMTRLARTLDAAFNSGDERALREVHKSLYLLYEQNFAAPAAPQAANQFHPFLMRIRNDIEHAWHRYETDRARIVNDDVPLEPSAFSEAFKRRCFNHALSRHRLFDFLEFKAGRNEIVEFFRSDSLLVLRFCDLVSMAMMGADDEVRGELAVNLWDEMGNGDPAMRHTKLFHRLLAYVDAEAATNPTSIETLGKLLDWQGLAGYNLHLFFSLHRENYFKSVGCLGSSELMDGPQYAKLLRGCGRVGIDDKDQLAYYANHVEIDAEHGENWLRNVLVPLVIKYPHMRGEIMLGAEIRLNVTCDYFTSVLRRLTTQQRNSFMSDSAATIEHEALMGRPI